MVHQLDTNRGTIFNIAILFLLELAGGGGGGRGGGRHPPKKTQ